MVHFKSILCLLLISCAGHKVKVDGSFGAVKGSVTVTETQRDVHAAPVVKKPQKRLSLPPRVIHTKPPKPIHIAEKRIEIAPLLFAIGRARPIPILWASSVAAVCKAHKVVLVGNSSPDGKPSRNKELACLRAKNAMKAVLTAGCALDSVSIRWQTGGGRKVEVR